MNTINLSPQDYIQVTDDTVKTTSLKVAEAFSKLHKDVIRKIRDLDCSPEFAERNFALCHENNDLQNGKPLPYYEMTKDGFMFLVMGFTGKKAAMIKEAYINAFNWMADQIKDLQKRSYVEPTPIIPPKPRSKLIPSPQRKTPVPNDVEQAIVELIDLVAASNLIGLSVITLYPDGCYKADYHGACIDKPELTLGILYRLMGRLSKQAELNSDC